MKKLKKFLPKLLFVILGFSFIYVGNAVAQTSPDLVVTSVDAPAQASTQESISVSWTIKNQGNSLITSNWNDYVYISSTNTLDVSATQVGFKPYYSPSLDAGAALINTLSIAIPNVSAGTYYLLIIADKDNYIYESNEDNNVLSRQINIGVPDLIVTSVDAPVSASTQETISISWTVKNQGNSLITSNWNDYVYISGTNTLDASATQVGFRPYYSPSLDAGAALTSTLNIAIPNVSAGTYYLLIIADKDNYIYESNEDNNVLSRQINIGAPDLIVTSVEAPVSASTQETISISWTVRNQGNSLITSNWNDYVYISSTNTLNASATQVGFKPYYTPSLDAGAILNSQVSITIPNVSAGTYYLLIIADKDNYIYESNEDNNVLSRQINIGIAAPVLTDIKWDNLAFTSGQTLVHPGEFSITAASLSGISKVEFYINGSLYKIDTNVPYSFYWNIAKEIDGVHSLKIIGYDSFSYSTTLEYNADVTLAPPLAPIIAQPVSGQVVNNSSITVTGIAEPESEVVFFNNNTENAVKAIADKTGSFSAVLTLSVGENKIQAAAKNRAGTGSRTAEIIVTYDNLVPNPPRQLSAESKESGAVKLSWLAPLGAIAKGYNIYRAVSSFSNKAGAEKINTDLIAAAFITDLPPEGKAYYYRVTAVSEAGNESDLSNEVIGISDNIAPSAVSIVYSPKGNYDTVTGTMAPGAVDIILTISEKLQAIPFLSITPQNASPIPIELSFSEPPLGDEESHPQYKGTFTISTTTPSGIAYAVFSARDLAGNRGTEILEGKSIKIDTQGPAIIDLKIEPKSPVKNELSIPTNIKVTIGLDEEIKNGEIPQFSYKLSGAGRQDIPVSLGIITTQPGHSQTWQGAFVLPSDAGSNAVETFEFSYSASDSLGNMSTTIKSFNQFQVYQNDLPPLEIPANFKGQSLSKGKIKLSWDKVAAAADYQIYRQAPSELELTAYVRTGDVAEYIDQPLFEGVYLYAIASVRKENNQEAVSAMSALLSLTSDSTAPGSPKNLSLELTSSGIKAQWQAPDGAEAVTYSLYRASTDTITSVEGLVAVLKGITQLTAIDTNPSQTDHAYVVIAVDAAGNESLPSNSFYLNFTLLPVSSISVTQADNSAPVVRWVHSGANISGYNIYLGPQENKVKLNQGLLNSFTYTDTGYTQNEREYSVSAVDSNSVESIARSIFLPKITATLKETSVVKRGLMNQVEFSVQNQSAIKIDNLRLKARLHTYDHTTEPFSIEAGETKPIALVLGGYADIPDIADFVTTIEITPNAGEKAEIIRNNQVEIKPGVLVAGIQNDEFLRGGAGRVSFTLQNTGNEEIEIITAVGTNPSTEIRFSLTDADGNFLAAVPFKQQLGENVITLSNGMIVARIQPGEIFTSSAITIPVPQNAPDKVFVKLDISKVHYNLGKDTHVEISGVSTSRELSLIDTAYYGEITSVTPLTSRGRDDITITGRAVNRSTGLPLALTPLKLVITVQGFERKSGVYTDASGAFSYTFKPQTGECGVYKVCAIHPDLLDRPNQAQFVINALQITPSQFNLAIPRNYEQTINLLAQAGEGTSVNNLKLVYEAADQAGGVLPAGVHLILEPAIPTLVSLQSTNLSFKLWADNNAVDSGTIVLKLKSDETPADFWGTITLNTQFSQAVPVLNYSPNYVETGVKFDEVATETVVLENKGFADLRDVKLSLVTTNGAAAPDWVRLNVAPDLGNIAVGIKKDAVISFAPKEANISNIPYSFFLRVTSANYPQTDIRLSAAVTSASGTGGLLFMTADIFTNPEDSSAPQGLSGAAITIQNDLLASIKQTGITDSQGKALFTELPSGSYKYWVSADKHSRQTGRIWIKPGITVTESVFLTYDLVTVEWSVRETTVQDKYEIILNATYETEVPAAVIVAEPKSWALPDMQAGDVFNAEVRFTNYGLIRADNLKLNIPVDDQYFDYSVLTVIPASLDAKQSVVVPVRLVCKKSLSASEPAATGGGCVAYTNCIFLGYSWVCPNGKWIQQAEYACFTKLEGECDLISGGGIGSAGSWLPGPGGSGSSSSGTYFIPAAVSLEECLPLAKYFEKFFTSPFWKWLKNLLIQVGCYVNVFTREYNDTIVDLSVKTPGGKIDITRWFYGNKWLWDPARNNLKYDRNSISLSLLNPPIFKGGVWYVAVGAGIWKHETYTITENPDGTFKWFDKHGNWIIYDSLLRVQSYGNKNGLIAAITYQQADNTKIDRILDRDSNSVIWFNYDSAGNITSVSDAQNHKVEYQYLANRLVKVIDVLGGQTVYEYDSDGRITKTVDAAGRATLVQYDSYGNVSGVYDSLGKGHKFEYGYNQQNGEFYTAITYPSGRIEEIWYNKDAVPVRIDVNGKTQLKNTAASRVETTANELGLATRTEYDEWENPVRIVYPDASVVSYEYEYVFNQVKKIIDQKGVITTFEYDSKGNLTKTIKASGTASQQIITCFYDAQGQLISLTTEADAVTEAATVAFVYDANGNIASITDALGNKTEFIEYDVMGNLLQKKDSRGNLWKYFYDAKGRLIKTESPKGTSLSYEYDGANNVRAIINHYLKRFDFEYDDHNNCVKMVDTYAKSVAKEYNGDNLVTKTLDQEGKENKAEYDNRGRLLAEIDGAGNRVRYHYADTAAVNILGMYLRDGAVSYALSIDPIEIDYPTYKKQIYYDKLQRIVEEKDILDETTSNSTKYTYDLAGNVTAIEDKQGNLTRFEYDALNRKIKSTDAGGSVTENIYDGRDNLISVKDANGGITRYSYDKNNRLIKVINPLGRETTYDYDTVGNRISAIDAKGQKITYEYDESNRLITTRYFKANDYVTAVKAVQFSYDAIGSLIGYNDGVTSAAYTYDDLLRKTGETVNYGLFSKTYSYSYYGNGAKKTFTVADGIALEYSYDENNRLSSINIPGHGQMTNNSYQWDSPAKTTFPGGTRREYAYSPLMEIKTINTLDTANNSLMRYDYNYSAESNVLQKVTEHGSYAYQYDKLHRLISAANPQNPAENYSYDSLGNRKTAAWTSGEWQYNVNNALVGFDSTMFTYDDNGNMARKVIGADAVNYIYDAADKLVKLEKDDATVIASYYYDPFGRRLWKDTGGIRTYYLYSDEGLAAEYDSTGAEIKSYAYLPNSQWSTNPLYQRVNGKYYWYQNDSLGTPQKILDTTGHVVWQGTYEAFGNVNITTSEIENNLRFAGQYYDKETGLYYNWNRYYNPELGRYISADPAGEGLNLYTYVFNNPNTFVDPRGLCSAKWIWNNIIEPLYNALFYPGYNYGQWIWGEKNLKTFYGASLDAAWLLSQIYNAIGMVIARGAPYWQYYPEGIDSYKSGWLARGWQPPYQTGSEAVGKLSLPPWNPGNDVRPVNVPWGQYVGGPRIVAPKYGQVGFGSEYKVGGFGNWGEYFSDWAEYFRSSVSNLFK